MAPPHLRTTRSATGAGGNGAMPLAAAAAGAAPSAGSAEASGRPGRSEGVAPPSCSSSAAGSAEDSASSLAPPAASKYHASGSDSLLGAASVMESLPDLSRRSCSSGPAAADAPTVALRLWCRDRCGAGNERFVSRRCFARGVNGTPASSRDMTYERAPRGLLEGS